MKKTVKAIGKFLFFLGIGLFFIWLFMRNLTPEEKREIFESFREANYWWILLSIAIGIISHWSRTVRWKMLLKPMGYNPKFLNVFSAVFIGYFANLALPRLGEVSRCGILARYEKIPFQKAFGTVVTERAIDMITFILLFFINLAIQFGRLSNYIQEKIFTPLSDRVSGFQISNLLLFLGIGLVILAIALFLFRRHFSHTIIYIKIKEVILGFIEGIKSLLRVEKPGIFIFHSVFIWACYFLMTYIVFNCLPETKSVGLDEGFAVFIFASIGIIIVQGGIGIYPAIVAETLALFHIPATKGYAMGWLLWTGQTLMIISSGLLALMFLPIFNRKRYDKA